MYLAQLSVVGAGGGGEVVRFTTNRIIGRLNFPGTCGTHLARNTGLLDWRRMEASGYSKPCRPGYTCLDDCYHRHGSTWLWLRDCTRRIRNYHDEPTLDRTHVRRISHTRPSNHNIGCSDGPDAPFLACINLFYERCARQYLKIRRYEPIICFVRLQHGILLELD